MTKVYGHILLAGWWTLQIPRALAEGSREIWAGARRALTPTVQQEG